MSKDISVIIVNWNTRDLLLQCIRSIKANTYRVNYEIIVVDNASEDGSQEALQSEFPEVRLIQNTENLGFAKANNIGMRASASKYMALVNSDVEVKEACLDKIFEYMENNAHVGMAGPKIYLPDGSLQKSFKRFPTLWTAFCEAFYLHRIFKGIRLFASAEDTFIDPHEISSVDMLIGAFWFVRNHALKQVGLLDEAFFFYGEDADWCKRFNNAGWRVIYYPFSEIIHYTGMSSATNPIKYYVQLYRAKLQYGNKQFNRSYTAILRFVFIVHQLNRLLSNRILLLFTNSSKKEIIHYKYERSLECFKWLLRLSPK